MVVSAPVDARVDERSVTTGLELMAMTVAALAHELTGLPLPVLPRRREPSAPQRTPLDRRILSSSATGDEARVRRPA
jgi:hypothetical protein